MLTNEILEIINKNLPAQVGEVLRERLEVVSKLEKENKELTINLKRSEKLLDIINNEKLKYENFITNREGLEKRKLLLDERERNFKLEIAELQIKESNKRENLAVDLVRTIFRNPVCRTVVNKQGDVPVIVKDYSGNEFTRTEFVDIKETTDREIV